LGFLGVGSTGISTSTFTLLFPPAWSRDGLCESLAERKSVQESRPASSRFSPGKQRPSKELCLPTEGRQRGVSYKAFALAVPPTGDELPPPLF